MGCGKGKEKALTALFCGVWPHQSTYIGWSNLLEAGILKCMKETFNLLYLAAIFFLIDGSILCSLLVGRITVALSALLVNKQLEGARLSCILRSIEGIAS